MNNFGLLDETIFSISSKIKFSDQNEIDTSLQRVIFGKTGGK